MAKKAKKKDPSWDQIGKSIGSKMEKNDWDKKCGWGKSWHKECGGGFGRLVFAIGLIFALSATGKLEAVPIWTLVVMVIGFTILKL